MFKFALFIAVALVAVQGFQARVVDSEFQDSGIIDIINRFIREIHDLVNGIRGIYGDLINGFIKEGNDTINQIHDLINQIRKNIEDLVAEAGEIGRKCVDTHEKDIEYIINTVHNGLTACTYDAQSQANTVRDHVNVLLKKVIDLQTNVRNRVAQCIKDPNKFYNCLRDLSGPIQEDIAAMKGEVSDTIQVVKDNVHRATVELAQCVAGVEQFVNNSQIELTIVLKDCIYGNIN